MSSLLIALVLSCFGGIQEDAALALQDRQQFPQEDWPYVYYITTSSVRPEHQLDLEVAICMMVASTSRQPIIEHCTPQIVGNGLLRMDLRDLIWNYEDWKQVLADYPYEPPGTLPLVIRADWLLVKLSDAQESDAYYRLLFGGKTIPKTRDEALQLLGVGIKSGPETGDYANFGMVEGKSRVAVNLVRWIENRPVQRGYAWGTRDILKVETVKDPLENLTGGFAHDGEEWIIGITKFSLATQKRGALQVYFLSNGQGGLVNRAPVDLVVDHTGFKGLSEIRVPGGCVQCHNKGLNQVSVNELKSLIVEGVDVFTAPKQRQQELEAFHLSELQTEIDRNCEDFAVAVQGVTGLTPEETAARFKRSIDDYIAPVNLAKLAWEYNRPEEEVKKALAVANSRGAQFGARLSGLAHGLTIPREALEARSEDVKQYLRDWEN